MTRGEIDALLRARGVQLWGVAANEPRMPLAPDLPRAVSLGVRHEPEAMKGVEEAPTPRYFEDYTRLNTELDAAAAALAGALRSAGSRAETVDATIYDDDAVEDWTDAGVFAHKTAATRAGLGWIGKTAILVTPEFGPWVRLATVFTDHDLAPDSPIDGTRCAGCRLCVDACPASAGRDVRWHAGMPRDDLLDAAACSTYSDNFPEFGGVCGVCLAVCPFGRRGAGWPNRRVAPRRAQRRP